MPLLPKPSVSALAKTAPKKKARKPRVYKEHQLFSEVDIAGVPDPYLWQAFAKVLAEDLVGLPPLHADWPCGGLLAGAWALKDMGVRHTGSGCEFEDYLKVVAENAYGREVANRDFRYGHDGDLTRKTQWMQGWEGNWVHANLTGAGPPCQMSSHMGKGGGLADPRAKVFARVVDRIKLQADLGGNRLWGFFIENVTGIYKKDKTGKCVIDVMMKKIKKIDGFTIKVFILNTDLILPQHRQRVYIVGIRTFLLERAGVNSIELTMPGPEYKASLKDCLNFQNNTFG